MRAAERLFSGVSQHVLLEVKRLCEGVIAYFATERFPSGMNQHVPLEINSLFGGEIAQCASKRLLTTMNQNMGFQLARPIACVVALVAAVRLLFIIQGILGMCCKVVSSHFLVFLQKIVYVVQPAREARGPEGPAC